MGFWIIRSDVRYVKIQTSYFFETLFRRLIVNNLIVMNEILNFKF